MSFKPVSIREILTKEPVEASAPCRVDAGGTWDIKALAMTLEYEDPVTVNAALDMRTRVCLLPYRDGWVRVSSKGFHPEGMSGMTGSCPFDPPFGLFFAAVERFGFHGVHVRIASDSPPRSALGGSSTALTALLQALSSLAKVLGAPRLPPRALLMLGYQLEEGVSGGFCGMQDQAAAVYGGVNLWRWRYGRTGTPFRREPLLDVHGCRDFSHCLLVAHSGHDHDSGSVNRRWVESFLSGRTRSGWVKANRTVHDLARALRARDWGRAAECLREEMAVRREITPDALIPETSALVEAAEAEGCGARFAGAGAGGAVWAVGPHALVAGLRSRWAEVLKPMKGGRLLGCGIDSRGVFPASVSCSPGALEEDANLS